MNTKEDYLIIVIFFTLGATVAFGNEIMRTAPVAEISAPAVEPIIIAKPAVAVEPVIIKKPAVVVEPVIIKKPAMVKLADWYDRIIAQESGGDPNAVSHKGATGLMQIMPATWADMTDEPYSKAKIPALNKKVGTKYLSWIQSTLRKWKGSEPTIEDILAPYNGGIGRYRNRGYDLSKMPKETREYVKKILDNG